MIKETYNLWKEEEYTYPVYGEFIPNVVTYIHDEDEQKRPAIIVVPGGGYCMVSPTEGEIIAMEFFEKGYNTFVVTYTTNLLMNTPLKMQPLKDLSKAVMFVRKNAEAFRVIPDKVAVCGFSAGGHLSASIAVHFDAKDLILGGEYEGVSNRPDAVILSYPVISSGEYAHRDSFIALLGVDASTEELEYMSLEKQVTKVTPPTFLWHTVTDGLVPVENSYLFANACRKHGVNVELHVFGNGHHGLSLATEDWARGNFGGDYTLNQYFETIQYLVDHDLELPASLHWLGNLSKGESVKEAIKESMKQFTSLNLPDEGIAIWPILAHNWLKKALNIRD